MDVIYWGPHVFVTALFLSLPQTRQPRRQKALLGSGKWSVGAVMRQRFNSANSAKINE